jgi:hypothetical protein
MYTIVEEIMIYRDPKTVFRYVSDFTNDVKWRSGVIKMKQSTCGFTETGTVTRETLKLLGHKWTNLAKITGCEENKKISFKVVKGIEGVSGYRSVYEIANNCTGFIYSLSISPKGIFKIITPLIIKSFRKRIRKDLRRLKQLLEQKQALAA